MLVPRSCVPRSLIKVRSLPVFVMCLFGLVYAFARDWLGKMAMAMCAAWCVFLCKDLCDDPDRCARQFACDAGIDLNDYIEPLQPGPAQAQIKGRGGNPKKKHRRKD